MAKVEHTNPAGLPAPVNGAYTHIVRVGPWAYVSGQTAGTPDGGVVGGEDAGAQAAEVYRRLGIALASVGGGFEHVLSMNTFVVSADDWPAVRGPRAAAFPDRRPTSSSVNITRLANPAFRVEIEAVAYLPQHAQEDDPMAQIEHLQPEGMPDNGNRYSHIVRVGPWITIAGQVAADAAGNVVGKGDPAAQVDQVYANLTRAMEAVGGTLADIVKTTVYVAGAEHLDAIRAARAGRFGPTPPTSTLLVVSRLANPDYLLEIEAVAYVPQR
jgi:enamine deaminase RidA (YjgF/YER057c/UK114 family)